MNHMLQLYIPLPGLEDVGPQTWGLHLWIRTGHVPQPVPVQMGSIYDQESVCVYACVWQGVCFNLS